MKKWISTLFALIIMLLIILDTKTAIQGAQEGINLCLYTVIPSLFPFFILSGFINQKLWGTSSSFLNTLGKICKIPKGAESILLLGFTGGYPVGAQLISQSYKNYGLTRKNAKRMLGFCNNAGPSFIFGILSPQFSNPITPWVIWLIHLLSAFLTGKYLTGNNDGKCILDEQHTTNFSKNVENAIKTTALVSGWIIFFRVILTYCNKWFMWVFPEPVKIIFCGLIELSNGSCQLIRIENESLRFLIACVLLAAGGLCVGMQTVSVTESLGIGMYFPGKVLQVLFTLILGSIIQPLLFQDCKIHPLFILVISVMTATLIWIINSAERKNKVAFRKKIMYNT